MSYLSLYRKKKLGDETIGKINLKIGNRVELLQTDDTWTKLEEGSKGTVTKIEEDQDLIWVQWDNGEKLALLVGVDKFKIIKK